MKLTGAIELEDRASAGTVDAGTLQALQRWLSIQAEPDAESPASWWRFFSAVARHRRTGSLDLDGLSALRARPEVALGPQTLQGRVLAQSHSTGLAMEVLSDIQCGFLAEEAPWRAWDEFFHVQPLAQALRHRPMQLQRVLCDLLAWVGGQHLNVLVAGCGAGLEVLAFLQAFPEAPVEFMCVDEDPAVLARTKDLCRAWGSRVRVHRSSLQRLALPDRYDLVWAMGLFDRLDDRGFLPQFARLQSLARPNMGHLVFDHLSLSGPSQAYLEWLDWPARSRSTAELVGLARVAGVPDVALDFEPSPGSASQYLRITCGF